MFSFFKTIGLNNPFSIFKYIPVILMAVYIVILQNQLNKTQASLEQANQILTTQSDLIAQLKEEVELVRKSKTATIESVKQIQDQKERIKVVVKKQIEVVTEKVEAIKADPFIDEEIKLELRSSEYIDSLNNTYCQLNALECQQKE